MIHVNPSKVQNRRACNRCHQAKLKCVLEGSRQCQRCKRSNIECTFSPPTRIQRQHAQARSLLSTSSNRTDCWPDVEMDWELLLEPSVLATFGLDTDHQVDNENPASAHNPTCIVHNNQNYNQNCAAHSASQDELLTPTPLFDVSSNSTTFASSIPATSTYTGYSGSPMPISSTGPTFAPSIPTTTTYTGYNGSPMPISSTGPTFAPSIPTTTTYTGYNGSPILISSTSSDHTAGRNASATSTLLSLPDSESEEHDEQLTDFAFWADKMAPLNVQFTRHLQSIPRVSPDSSHYSNGHTTILPPSGSHNSDTTFQLSESLINILSGMCSQLPPLHASATANDDCSTTFLSLDEASYLLIFSTYLRFLETQDAVYRYLLACLVHKHETATTGSCFYLPKLTIGSFALAMTSKTRPLLFVNLMESMLARAKNFIHRLASVKGTSGNNSNAECFSSLSPIVEPTFALQAIQTREAAVLNLIGRIKEILAQSKST